ncbi:phenylalanine--tRNA ligase subunit beta [Halapricum salinum]|uniref:Phenylalanine--tRNA ligase beta subunit n=1 Tax=Halapricum salinum TaxID=1457250 RepID=A0A4D6HBA0_9EURY|nr:phenylalanine--tRNA ligase subunit beta [Halapricum salinum]QCC51354.1 phenylalanine--tRNA ligase subunit beta [Halapricum salinum]
MPTVDIATDELRELTGYTDTTDEEFKTELFDLGLEFEGETEDGELQFEFEPDRLDRLSVEGVARSLRYDRGDSRGVHVPDTNSADWTIEVEDVPEERPYVTGAIVRGLDLSESAFDSLIQLQEKLHATMGRKRAKGAIGVHDLTMLKGEAAVDGKGKSIRYTGVDPEEATFVPLESDAEMTPAEVIAEHHIGQEYAHLVEDMDRVPAIYDSIGLFSFPPVINGKRTEVTTNSRDLFIEMTGTDQWTIDHMLNIVCYALAARGGTIEDVNVEYETAPEEYPADLVRPDFSTKTKTVVHDRIETALGIELSEEEVLDLLERSGLEGVSTDVDGEAGYEVTIPPYRVDVLHPVDVIDDVGRAYGFNDLEPRYPDVGTIGGRHERSRLARAVRQSLVGLGFQDLLNFHMTDAAQVGDRMNLGDSESVLGSQEPVRITNPYSEDYTIARSWLLPSIMQVLENNTHRSYPQDLSEVGWVAHRDDEQNTRVAEARHVAGVLARHGVSYEDGKARLQALVDDYDAELETPPTEHPSFISGRVAEVVIDGDSVGVLGEIHPEVLVEHDLELPVVAFEFDLDALR